MPFLDDIGGDGRANASRLYVEIQKLGNRLDADAECNLRLVHEGAEVLEITSKKMACLVFHGYCTQLQYQYVD